MTAEAVTTKKVGFNTVRVFAPLPGRPNHYLDCRVYNRAAHEKLLLDRLSAEDWLRLQIERHADPEAEPPKPRKAQKRDATDQSPEGDWLGTGDEPWL